MNIPYTISALRGAGLTQTQIGDEVGVKQSTISDMESGKSGIKRPSHRLVTGLNSLALKYGIATEPAIAPRSARARHPRKPSTVPP